MNVPRKRRYPMRPFIRRVWIQSNLDPRTVIDIIKRYRDNGGNL